MTPADPDHLAALMHKIQEFVANLTPDEVADLAAGRGRLRLVPVDIDTAAGQEL